MDKLFSVEEARRIFALAAEREQSAQAESRDQLTLAELEEAGLSAGIDPAFIRSAVADTLRPDPFPIARTLLGMPVEIRRTSHLPRPMDDAEWSRLVAKCQQAFGREGVVTDLGDSREWASEAQDSQMPVRVILENDGDNSRLTIERKTWRRAVGFSIGSAINLAMGLVLFVAWMASGFGGEGWVPATALTVFGILFGAGAILGLRREGRLESEKFEAIAAHLGRIVVPLDSESAASEVAEDVGTGALRPLVTTPSLSVDLDSETKSDDSAEREPRRERE